MNRLLTLAILAGVVLASAYLAVDHATSRALRF